MRGLMQDGPLTLDVALRRADLLWGTKPVSTAGRDGMQRTTYGAWAERVRRLAGVLDDLGVSGDGRVGTFGWNTARHLELYFAAPCTGRVLHTVNIRLFADQIDYVVRHAGDEVVFADRSLLGILWPIVERIPEVRHVVVMDDGAGEVPDDPRILDYETLLAAAEPATVDRVTDEHTAAAMCYTSGTTGNPKGVVYSHRSVMLHSISAMLADTMGLCEADVVLPVVPMFHANAWGLCQAAVLAGSSLVFPGADLSPQAVSALMVDEDVTLAAGVPTIWMAAREHLAARRPAALRMLLCGGSAVPRSLSEAYRTEIGVPILQGWGMTETSPLASVSRVRSDRAGGTDDEVADLRATQGLPVPLVDLRIADPVTGAAQPWDGTSSGEIQVAGPWIAASYYDDERSAASFAADGWLRTGDLGVVDPDGYIHLVDRTKDVIKSGGEWISSVDLENTIMGHPDVAEAAVVAVPSERWMERPVAFVVLRQGRAMTDGELLDWLRDRVAKWWLPDRVLFIEEVPKTSVGKFSKKDLRDRLDGLRVD